MNKQKRKNFAMQSSGVTLIALIITIIILLILAVTSVVLVMRWNMLDKTEYAAEGYQGASERDILEVAFGEYAMDKTTGNESAQFSVGDEGEGTTVVDKIDKNKEKTGWTVTFSNGHEYAVDEDGMIRRTSTGPLGEAVDPESYGKKVNFKSRGEGLEDLIWRIFYKDAKNVYLISEKPDKKYPILNLGLRDIMSKYSEYSNGTDVSKQGQDLMMLAKENGEVFAEGNTSNNIKGTAYFCDITKWEDYLDEAGLAAWAMGGPTVELFVKSYDATQKQETKLRSTNLGYLGLLTTKDVFKENMNNGIYRLEGASSKNRWWVASPDATSGDRLCTMVESEGCFFSNGLIEWPGVVRPVVCIPTENFNGFTVTE